MTKTTEILTVGGVRTRLGEGIRYDAETDSLRWVDIPESRVWQMTRDGRITRLSLGPEAAFACTTTDGHTLSGTSDGFYLNSEYLCGRGWFDQTEVLNDGAVHPNGNILVFGSRDRAEENALGHMWTLGSNLDRLPWNFTVFNGPAFSTRGDRIYFADSPKRIIYVASVDVENQTIGERRVFAIVPEALGYPDGMACDDEDGLWSAHWDGGCVTRYLSNGNVDRRVNLPASRPTSVAFKEHQVYVTSAMDDTDQGSDALDGSLFVFHSTVSGPPSVRLDATVLKPFTSSV